MIIPKLIGGLGNQMFQIATAYAAAKQNNEEFGINYNLLHVGNQGFGPLKYKNTLYKNIPETNTIPSKTWQEPDMCFNPITYTKDFICSGYFQTEKYFINYQNEIRNLFTFPDDIKMKVDNAFNRINTKKVGIHIRGGDYKQLKTVYTQCDSNYYQAAYQMLNDNINTFIVCTDDIPYAIDILNKTNINYYLANSKNELEDLYLLTKCNSIIMGNSSFAWWGAWLTDKDMVICPKYWFGPDGPKENDIIVPNWKTIYGL